MAEQKTVIIDLKIDTSGYIKNVVDAKAKVNDLKAANAALKTSIQEAAAAGEDLTDLNVALAENEAAVRDATTELKQYEKQVDNATKANKAAAGSYEELYRQYVDAEIQLKTLEGTIKQNADGTFELTEEYKAAQARVLALKDGLLEFNAGIKDGRLNVGNYAQAFEGVIGKLNGFGQALGPAGAGLTQIAAGFEAAKKAGDGLKEKLGNTLTGIKDGFMGARDSIVNFAKGVDDSGQSISRVGVAGKAMGTALKGAIASTGIGLLVVAVGSLVAYFTKTLEGSRKIQVAFAAVSGAVNGLIKFLGGLGKSLIQVFTSPIESGKKVIDYLNNTYIKAWVGVGKVLQGVFTLDFDKVQEGVDTVGKAIQNGVAPIKAIGKGFQDAGQAAIKAAKDAADLEQRGQKLNDLKREAAALNVKEKAEAENLVKLAEDKSLTEQQRLQALEDAAAKERAIEQRRLEIAEESLAIKQKELEVNGSNEQLLDDIASAEAEAATVRAEASAKITDAEIKQRNLERDFAAQRAGRAVAESQAELALAQAQGRDTLAIRKQIAEQEKQAALLAAAESGEARATIEKQYLAKIETINQEVRNQAEAVRREAFDREVALFGDTKEKEIAIAAEALRRELADFDRRTVFTEEDERKRQAIKAAGANALLQIDQKYAAEALALQQSVAQRGLDQTVVNIDAEAAARKRALDLRLAEIDAKPQQQRTAEDLAFQQQAAAQSVAIEQDRLNKILAAQVAAAETRKANDKKFYDDLEAQTREKLTAAGASEEAIRTQIDAIQKQRKDTAVKTEQETADQIRATQEALNANLAQGEIARLQQTKSIDDLQRQGRQENVDNLQSTLGEVAALLSQDEKSRKKYANAIKALSIAEVYFNLYKEIAGYWAGAGSDSAKSVLAGIPATVLAGVRTAVAIARATIGAQSIMAQKFAEGGMTNMGDVVDRYQPTMRPSFGGGYVDRPTLWPGAGRMNLAGEAGAEYVAPAWQLRQAPTIFAGLESWRRTGVRPFADGGLTTAAIAQPILNSVAGIEDAVARGFAKAPAPVVAVTEITEVTNRVSLIESRANL
jgi:hypothetical protein